MKETTPQGTAFGFTDHAQELDQAPGPVLRRIEPALGYRSFEIQEGARIVRETPTP